MGGFSCLEASPHTCDRTEQNRTEHSRVALTSSLSSESESDRPSCRTMSDSSEGLYSVPASHSQHATSRKQATSISPHEQAGQTAADQSRTLHYTTQHYTTQRGYHHRLLPPPRPHRHDEAVLGASGTACEECVRTDTESQKLQSYKQ